MAVVLVEVVVVLVEVVVGVVVVVVVVVAGHSYWQKNVFFSVVQDSSNAP